MAELISSGPVQPPRQWRPPSWLLLVVAAAVLAGAVRLWGGVSDPERPAEPAATVSALPTRPPTTVPGRAQFRLDVRPGQAPADLRLLIGPGHYGSPQAVAWPAIVSASGELSSLTAVRAQAGQTIQASRIAGATVLVLFNEQYVPIGATVLADDGRTVRLGPGLDTVLSAYGGGLLAADSAIDAHPGRLVSLTAAGKVRWQRRVTAPTELSRDTPYGLVALILATTRLEQTGGALVLLDPRTGAELHRIGGADAVLASTDRKVAWVPHGCSPFPGHCSLVVTELDTRFQSEYVLPNGRIPMHAAFSPDQSAIALSFGGQHELVADPDPDGYVAVQPLSPGTMTRMPGLTTEAKQSPALAWLPDGQLVVAVHHPDGRDRLLLWQPSSQAPLLLPRELPDYSASIYLATLP